MELWQSALLLAVGAAAGFLNVMAGGGSLLTVPTMVFLGMPGPVANGTNRIALLVQNIVAVGTFFRRGYSDFRLSLTLAAASLPGAIIGAYAGTRLDGVWFNRTLAAIMIGVMILMATRRNARASKQARTPPPGVETNLPDERVDEAAGLAVEAPPAKAIEPRRLLWGHLGMGALGFYGGFIQIGIGFLIMPLLHRVMGLDLVRVNMHKVFVIGVYTVAALAVFASRVEIVWLAGAALAAGNALGGWLGAHTSVSRGEGVIRFVLYSVLVVFVVKLLFF